MYRTNAITCPACGDRAPLREYERRYVCDECGGMQLALADFCASLTQIDHQPHALELVDAIPSETPCPQCQRPMEVGVLERDGRVFRGVLGCPTDGLWIPRAVMTRVFYLVEGNVVSGGAGGYSGPPPAAGSISSMNLPTSEMFGSRISAGRLSIQNWQSNRPRVHTPYVSPHKDRRLACPACPDTALACEGERWSCRGCAGTFFEDTALAELVSDVANRPWSLPDASGAAGPRSCPICESPMVVETLETVAIDRCPGHGVWFDETELQAALHHAIEGEPAPGGWLRKLFHRSGPIV